MNDQHEPLTYGLRSGDLGYIVDALIDAAEARRARGGGALQERIADHLDELAIRLHDAKVEAIKALP